MFQFSFRYRHSKLGEILSSKDKKALNSKVPGAFLLLPWCVEVLCSKTVFLLLIHCFMYLPLFVGALCLVIVLLCITQCPF